LFKSIASAAFVSICCHWSPLRHLKAKDMGHVSSQISFDTRVSSTSTCCCSHHPFEIRQILCWSWRPAPFASCKWTQLFKEFSGSHFFCFRVTQKQKLNDMHTHVLTGNKGASARLQMPTNFVDWSTEAISATFRDATDLWLNVVWTSQEGLSAACLWKAGPITFSIETGKLSPELFFCRSAVCDQHVLASFASALLASD